MLLRTRNGPHVLVMMKMSKFPKSLCHGIQLFETKIFCFMVFISTNTWVLIFALKCQLLLIILFIALCQWGNQNNIICPYPTSIYLIYIDYTSRRFQHSSILSYTLIG